MRRCFIALIFLSVLHSLSAQHRGFVGIDSIPEVLQEYIDYTTSRHFHEPSFPRFMLMDKSRNFVFGIGGYVNIFGYYDKVGNKEDGFFVRDVYPDNHGGSLFNFSVNRTRMFFKLIGRTKRAGMIQAYIDADFSGSSPGVFRLKQAYIDLWRFRVGQSFTTFMPEVSINTVDPQGPVDLSSRKLPLVRYTHHFSKKLEFAVAAEFPQVVTAIIPGDEEETKVMKVAQTFPDVPVVVRAKNDRYTLFAGLNFRYTKFSEYERIFNPIIAIALRSDFSYIFHKGDVTSHRMFVSACVTHGMVDVIQDFSEIGMNMVVNPNQTDVRVKSACAASLGYQLTWKKNNEINAVYSLADLIHEPDNEYNLYSLGQYAAVNYIRRVITYGRIGAEAVWGRKKMTGGDGGNGFRIYLLLRYDF